MKYWAFRSLYFTVAILCGVLVHTITSLAATTSTVTSVEVKALVDRDLVIVKSEGAEIKPQSVVKLYPTRIETLLPNVKLKAVNPQVKGTTLVKNVLIAGDTDTAVLVVYLDVKGKVDKDAYRWTHLKSGVSVLEVFYPLSDRSPLTSAMLDGKETPKEPVKPIVETPTQLPPQVPPSETPPTTLIEPALPQAKKYIELVYFSTVEKKLTIKGTDLSGYQLEVSKFPPQIQITFPGTDTSPTVLKEVIKNFGAIRAILVSSTSIEGGFNTRVTLNFVNSLNIKYEENLSADNTTLVISLPLADKVLVPESAQKPEEVKPLASAEPTAENGSVRPEEPTVAEGQAAEEKPVEEEKAEEPAPVPPLEVKPKKSFKVPPVEKKVEEEREAVAQQEPTLSASLQPTEEGMISYINYDPSTLTLTITTTKEATLNIVPVTFPRGYNIFVDLPPSPSVLDYIFKNDANIRYLSVAKVLEDESAFTRIIITFANDSQLGFQDTSTQVGTNFVLRLAEVPPQAPKPKFSSGRFGSEMSSEDEGQGISETTSVRESEEIPGVDDVFAEEVETDKEYPRVPVKVGPAEGEYELPEFPGMEERLSDVLVNLPAPSGLSVYQVLYLMSSLAGISIIIDPYITDPPIGGRTQRRVLDPLQFEEDGAPIGFREASQFYALITEPGTVRGNFENVPWDTALDIILEVHQFEKIVYRDPNDPNAKPVILITSRERKEQEIKGANVIDFYQLHYADPAELYLILYNLDLLPSINVGWYVYTNRSTRGGFGGGFGGGGFGGGIGGGFGGGGFGGGGFGGGGFSANIPPTSTVSQGYLDANSALAGSYFGDAPLQGAGPGFGAGGGAGGVGGAGAGGFGGVGGAGAGGAGIGFIPLPTAKSGLIVMRGSRETLDVVKSIIRKIDKPPKQAAVKLTVYQVTENPQKVYGLVRAAAPSGRTNITYDQGGLDLSFVTRPEQGGLPAGFRSFRVPHNIGAVFDALAADRKAKVVTETELAVIDGFPAVLSVDRTRGNFRQSIAFDQNGNAIRTSTFDEITVGTNITFTPNIDDWGRMTLFLVISLSSFDGPPQVSPDGLATFQPTTDTNLQTFFRLMDGETAMIGGLQTRQVTDEIFAVPFLSELPFVGSLFQHHSKSEENSYVFVTLTVNLVDDK